MWVSVFAETAIIDSIILCICISKLSVTHHTFEHECLQRAPLEDKPNVNEGKNNKSHSYVAAPCTLNHCFISFSWLWRSDIKKLFETLEVAVWSSCSTIHKIQFLPLYLPFFIRRKSLWIALWIPIVSSMAHRDASNNHYKEHRHGCTRRRCFLDGSNHYTTSFHFAVNFYPHRWCVTLLRLS